MANSPRPNPLHILVLPGDGIGPEVVAQGMKLLEFLADLHGLDIRVTHDLIGGQCWDKHGTFCRDETVSAARASDGVLVGAVGGPQWDNLEISGAPAEKDGLMRLRQELEAYAGLRPSRAYNGLYRGRLSDPRSSRVQISSCCGKCAGAAFTASPVESGNARTAAATGLTITCTTRRRWSVLPGPDSS